jgi:mannonate dehydratase
MKDNRRDFIIKTASLAAVVSLGSVSSNASELNANVPLLAQPAWPIIEGENTPKICLNASSNMDFGRMRMYKQFGVDTVLMTGPRLPWTEKGLNEIIGRFKAEGIAVVNMMLTGIPKTIYGQEGRDEEIRMAQDSLIAAGAAGLPVVEYNFYAHRLTEGYYDVPGRGGSQYLGFDYSHKNGKWTYPAARAKGEETLAPKDLKAKPDIGIFTSEELWKNITYFLKAVIPVAEKADVRMALHPNDPPVPLSRGSQQIMTTLKDWKRLLDIVDSPSNGMTYDCGVSNEIGENPIEVLKYMAKRDRINHVHYRNCIVETPNLKYVEVFPDNGSVNMFAVMQELVKSKYKLGIFPEHPRGNELDKKLGGDFVGYLYNVAYARAMFQAVINGK